MFNQAMFNKFIIENKVVGFFQEPITLKSGRKTNFYANWRTITSDVFLMDQLSDFIIAFVKEKGLEPDCFMGVGEGATKFGVITQFKWAKSQPDYEKGKYALPMERGKPKEHGVAKDRFFVGMPLGKTIVLEDATTTGGSLAKTLDKLKESGVNVIATIVMTNRNEVRDDGKLVNEFIEEKGMPCYALSNALNVLPQMIKNEKPEVIQMVKNYFKKYGKEELKI